VKTVPTTKRGRETVERILDAAACLFHEQGVRATGLDQIGDRADAGKGQLYHFFVDKADLVHEVIEHQVEQALAAQEPGLSGMSTLVDLDRWLALLVAVHVRAPGPYRCPLGALLAELACQDPAARDALAVGFARWLASIRAGLERIRDGGELDPGCDCDALASGLLAAYEGGLVLVQATGSLRPLEAALATARQALPVTLPETELGDQPFAQRG